MKLSQRAEKIEPSVTLAAAAKARALKAQGLDVISLTVGEPDFATPVNIQEAAIKAISSGKASYYTPSPGTPELREAIVEHIKRFYGLTYEIKNVVVADGAKFALYALFQAILDPNDEVIVPVPYWVSYGEQIKLAEGVPVYVDGKESNHFKITVEQLETARTEKTKAMILNSPSNPTGMIYSKEELAEIGHWAVEHDILIVADDIYGRLVYNGNEFTPMATISEEIRKNTIIINGVSKTYAMTGWRIGYAVGDETIIKAMIDIISQSTSNAAAVSQAAAVEALRGEQDTVEEMRQAFEARLNKVYPQVAALPGVEIEKPQGAFYLFPNVKKAMAMGGYDHVNDWVADLLEQEQVALVTGAGFGAPENVRISYAADLETIEEGIARIARFIENTKK